MYKTSKFLSTFVKIAISLWAVYYLMQHFEKQHISIEIVRRLSLLQILILFLLSLVNWSVEIRKWQYLASNVKQIDFFEASRQSLISFALSLLTPNRVGELGIKTLFFDKRDAKKIFSLSLIGTTTQMLNSLLFGFVALLILLIFDSNILADFASKINIHLSTSQQILTGLVILLFIGFIIFVIKQRKKKLLLNSLSIWIKTFGFSFIRYLVFSFQFLLIYSIFSSESNLFLVYIAIALTYLVATIIPMLAFMDWAVKGSVALSVFGFLHLQSDIAVVSVALMWLLNFLLPFVAGIYLLWQWKKVRD
jgi:hypothetical protein